MSLITAKTSGSKLCPEVLQWLEMVESGEVAACKDQLQLAKYVRKCFATEDIYTDIEQLEKYKRLLKYFPYERLFPWQEFCIALHLCTYWRETGRPRWGDLLLLVGRGAGKDGYIAYVGLCLVSPFNPIPAYDVDICATAEDVAMRPVDDVIAVLENERQRRLLKRHFYWTKEKVVGLKFRSTMRGRTNNPRTKDGMRSGIVVFNEVHQYENYANIKVFKTGLGKTKHPRQLYATTNGDVRESPLDDMIERSELILKGEVEDNGLLPFICRLDNKAEADDSSLWVKANPSLPYLPELMTLIEKEYIDWKTNPAANADFMTKRMNLPQSAVDVAVTSYENLKATQCLIVDGKAQDRIMPALRGRSCVVGLDYASLRDFASVNLRFVVDGLKYDINHSWFCLQSPDMERIKAPIIDWANEGLITLVDDVEIHPALLANWILAKGQEFHIVKLALDNYRYALVKSALEQVGFDAKERRNIHLVRPSDIYSIVPIMESDFVNQRLVWGDNRLLRWAANNTKVVKNKVTRGVDTGNRYYAKIEGRSRKTDPFMAVVHAAIIEHELSEAKSSVFESLPVITA